LKNHYSTHQTGLVFNTGISLFVARNMHPHAAAMSHSMTRFILCGCLLMLCFVSPLPVSAQSILDLKIEANHIGKNIAHVLDDFQSRSPGRIFFIDEWLNTILVDESLVGQTLRDGLTELFLGTDLSYIDVNANTLVIVRDPQQVLIRRNIITKAAREKKEITKLVIGNSGRSDKKMKTVTGLVKDRKSREILAGVSVSIADTGHGAISDALGRFSLSMLPGEYVLSFRAVNYEEKIIELSLYADGEVAIDLEETPMLLQEVVVEDKFAREITTSGIGQARISMKVKLHRAIMCVVEVWIKILFYTMVFPFSIVHMFLVFFLPLTQRPFGR
jgi:hypothetical protein